MLHEPRFCDLPPAQVWARLLDELRPSGDPIDIRIACGGERAFGQFVELIRSPSGAPRNVLA